LTCADVDTQVWAQSVFDTAPTRFAALDPDGNGVACDWSPAGASTALWTNTVLANAEPVELARVAVGDAKNVLLKDQNEPVRLIVLDTRRGTARKPPTT
jgi:hypothetical protein